MSEMKKLIGTTEVVFQIGGPHGPKIVSGNGDPNTVIPGNPGDLYVNRAGGAFATLWVKETGINTSLGWVPK